jgi:predicted ATPase
MDSAEQKIQMQVANFGPIDKANIQLTNCAFFAGKNNVGKSVMAQLLYSILKVVSPTLDEATDIIPELVEEEFTNLITEVAKKSPKTKPASKKTKGKNGGSWKISQKDLKTIKSLSKERKSKIIGRINKKLSKFCHDAMKEKVKGEMMYTFSSPIFDYIRLGQDSAKILLEYKDNIFDLVYTMGVYRKSKSIRCETVAKVDSDFLGKYLDEMFKGSIKHLKGKGIRYSYEKGGKLNVKFPHRAIEEKIYNLPSEIYKPWNIYFLPSGRAGLLEGFKVVSSAFYKGAPVTFLSKNKPSSVTGVVADYYGLLMNFEGKKGPYNKMAKEMLSKTMEGMVELDSKDSPFTIMKYRLKSPDNKETVIDITKASSMVKELAPVFMLVSEKLQPNDILIIEEPESHLQSKTQLELAEFFFNLSREGARILVTTHSELMLRQSFQLFNEKDLNISGNLFIFKESA